MKDTFDIYSWNHKRYLVEDIEEQLNEELPSISDLLAKNDLRVEAVAKAIIDNYVGEDGFEIKDDGRLRGIIRGALADHVYESDDPTIGAEEEGDPNDYVVGEGLNDRISKIDIGYTDPPSGRRLYSVKVDDANGKRLGKLYLDDTNDLLKMLGIDDEIPRSISFGDEKILDSIVKQLQDQGIDASWDDLMDVS